jgi:hypothetical protein
MLHSGETYRAEVKDMLMGRGPTSVPRAKFHKSVDVAALFDGKSAPEPFLRTGWWHFGDITVPGGSQELEAAYTSLYDALALAPELPISEESDIELDEDLLEALPRLWPPLQEGK